MGTTPEYSIPQVQLAMPQVAEMLPNPIRIVKRAASEVLKFFHNTTKPNVIFDNDFFNLSSNVQYVTGYASAIVVFRLYLQNRLPDKLIITTDIELGEPLVILVYNRDIQPEEEIQILRLVSKTLLELAESNNNDDYIDIHFIVKEKV